MLKHFLKNFAAILLSISLVSNCWAGIDFDGADDFVDLGSASLSIASGESFTVIAWIKTTEDEGIIFSLRNSTDGAPIIDLAMGYNGAGGTLGHFVPLMRFNDTSGLQYFTSTAAINNGTWQFVALRFDNPNNTFDAFIGTTKYSLNNSSNGSITGSVDIAIGRESRWVRDSFATANQRYFDGEINEFAYWKGALTDAELTQIASSRIKGIPLQIQPANLKGYWPMDDQETGTSADTDNVRDLSGNGNNGTGDNGANNTGLSWVGESILSYQPIIAMFGGSGAVIATIPSLIINGTVFIQNMIVQ